MSHKMPMETASLKPTKHARLSVYLLENGTKRKKKVLKGFHFFITLNTN